MHNRVIEFDNLSPDQNNNSENITNCKHYDLEEIQTINKLNKKCTLSPFHANSFSLSKNIEVLEYLLNSTSTTFDANAISAAKRLKGINTVNSLNLTNYSHEFCPIESSSGGTLLYIRSNLSYKPQNGLCIYKATELIINF